jgi:hypothetical protein
MSTPIKRYNYEVSIPVGGVQHRERQSIASDLRYVLCAVWVILNTNTDRQACACHSLCFAALCIPVASSEAQQSLPP